MHPPWLPALPGGDLQALGQGNNALLEAERLNSAATAGMAAPKPTNEALCSHAPECLRSGVTAGPKVFVPKPVNLPSLRKENAGNDVTTQIVPTSGGGSWQQPQGEQQTPAVNRPNWAASGGDPAPAYPSGPARDRRLNPHDYPSLSAAAAARHQSKQPVPSVPESQGVANWDEDERRLPPALANRPAVADWDGDRGARPPWEARHGDWPAPARGPEDERWGSSAERFGPAPVPRGGPRGTADRFSSFDRFGGGDFAADDVELFPPPPPPPPAGAGRGSVRSEAAEAAAASARVDEEREAFLAELERVAEEQERKRKEAERQAAAAENGEHVPSAAPEPAEAALPVPAPTAILRRPAEPRTLAAVAAANADRPTAAEVAERAAAPADKLAARRAREAAAEEAERKRKEAAAAKLRALEERIALRAAERQAEEEAERARQAATEAEVEAAGLAAAEPAGEEGAKPDLDAKADSQRGSSLVVQVDSSVALDSAASVSSEAGDSRVASEPPADTARGDEQPEVVPAPVVGAFGQSPFVPTGKQPDWSTGPITSSAGHSPVPQPYARSPALESVLPHMPFGERRVAPELQGLPRSAGPMRANGRPAHAPPRELPEGWLPLPPKAAI
ncbi:hypothetical protein WJX81_000196 [Elliptochloris bilobata]|uniref:BAT2 N-terminal domain-containing protein n=1 Tax=Elliptochloris bilobata TaxID=381761 RepID=A0AAW1SDD4_9CHLO